MRSVRRWGGPRAALPSPAGRRPLFAAHLGAARPAAARGRPRGPGAAARGSGPRARQRGAAILGAGLGFGFCSPPPPAGCPLAAVPSARKPAPVPLSANGGWGRRPASSRSEQGRAGLGGWWRPRPACAPLARLGAGAASCPGPGPQRARTTPRPRWVALQPGAASAKGHLQEAKRTQSEKHLRASVHFLVTTVM